MSIYDKTDKCKDNLQRKGTGFWVEGFGHVSIEWTEPEEFNKDYSEIYIHECMQRATKRLLSAINLSFK